MDNETVQCRSCIYFKLDRRWDRRWLRGTPYGSNGWCLLEPRAVEKAATSYCSHWTPEEQSRESNDG